MMMSNHRNPLGMFGAGPIEMLALRETARSPKQSPQSKKINDGTKQFASRVIQLPAFLLAQKTAI